MPEKGSLAPWSLQSRCQWVGSKMDMRTVSALGIWTFRAGRNLEIGMPPLGIRALLLAF